MSNWSSNYDDFISRFYTTDDGEEHFQSIYTTAGGAYRLRDEILNSHIDDNVAEFSTMTEAIEVADGWKSMENRV